MNMNIEQTDIDFWNAIGMAFPTAATEFVAAAADGIESANYTYDSTIFADECKFTEAGFAALLGACRDRPEDMMVVDSEGQRVALINGIYLHRVRAAVSTVIDQLVIPQMLAAEKPRGILIPVKFGR